MVSIGLSHRVLILIEQHLLKMLYGVAILFLLMQSSLIQISC